MTTVRIADFRRAGICPDAKIWFARHGLDWHEFVLNGIDAEALKATNDQQDNVTKVIAFAEEREALDGRR